MYEDLFRISFSHIDFSHLNRSSISMIRQIDDEMNKSPPLPISIRYEYENACSMPQTPVPLLRIYQSSEDRIEKCLTWNIERRNAQINQMNNRILNYKNKIR